MFMNTNHRLTDRLTNYWLLLKEDAAMPPFSRFSISTVSDIWQQCVLFTVQPDNHGVSFYQVGEQAKALYGDVAGNPMSAQVRHYQHAAIVRRMDEMLATPQVMYDQGEFMNEQGKLVKYRSCMLPFGENGKVTHVLAGLSWREF